MQNNRDMNYQNIRQAQKRFYHSGATRSIAFRKEQLKSLKNLIQSNEELFYDAIYKDFRKSRFETYTNELSIIYAEIDYYLKNLKRIAKPKRVRTNLTNIPGQSYIYHDPLGTVLIIGAWNYPYQLTLTPLVSAIAGGNTAIIKPSELPMHTMYLMEKLINTNFPKEYLHVVTGAIPETTALLALAYDKIFFTGSPKVGKIVYEAAAKQLCPVTLELGGKSPAILTPSANLKVAIKRLVWGKFLNAGQTCIAPDYLYVHESIKTNVLQIIKEILEKIPYNHGADHYVSIIDQRNYNRLEKMMNADKVYYKNGEHNPEKLHFAPTIMSDVTWDDTVMQDEIFGPILPVLTYNDFRQVLETINDKEKPLSAYLFSNDAKEKDAFLNILSFGGGCINDTIMHVASEYLPFGGVGNSGTGNYHGEAGFRCFTHQKSVLKKANWGEPNLKYPPYTENKLKWIKKVL
ncbi:aldehyde dehydrogenase [Sphingobacterium faecium]|nr:aldehyde dehydrogenase [Sphingobacterium faecium]MDH5826221.1 aldehyde dehydrogenase [Sphingobacterium faecium]